jgi:hypothetical protein
MLAPGAAKSCCAGAANAISRLLQSNRDLARWELKFHNPEKPRLPRTGFDTEMVTENTLKPRQKSKKAPKSPSRLSPIRWEKAITQRPKRPKISGFALKGFC